MKKLISILFLLQVVVALSYAQDQANPSHTIGFSLPEIAGVGVEGRGGNSITIMPTFSGEAGDGLDFSGARDESLWLNYTSVLPRSVRRRSISVEAEIGALPDGMTLYVQAADPSGVGDVGRARNNRLRLSTRPQNLINRIETCFTNNGVGEGSQLTYELEFDNQNFEDLTAVSSAILVTYTLYDR